MIRSGLWCYLPEIRRSASGGDVKVLGEFAKYAFFDMKMKRRDFERSVLRYVSIKISALTHSGRKDGFA